MSCSARFAGGKCQLHDQLDFADIRPHELGDLDRLAPASGVLQDDRRQIRASWAALRGPNVAHRRWGGRGVLGMAPPGDGGRLREPGQVGGTTLVVGFRQPPFQPLQPLGEVAEAGPQGGIVDGCSGFRPRATARPRKRPRHHGTRQDEPATDCHRCHEYRFHSDV